MPENLEGSRPPSITEAQSAARTFLATTLPEVRRVDITRVTPVTAGEATWEAEAEVWQPNPTLEALGIQTERPVLDHTHYLILLDELLNVLAYELEGSTGKGNK